MEDLKMLIKEDIES